MLPKTNCGLYPDDGLIFLKKINGHQIDRKRQAIIKIFKEIGFSTDIQTNL